MRAIALGVATAAFVGWLGWLTYAALTKERGPILSRSLIAVATHPVVAELREDATVAGAPATEVVVHQALSDRGPPPESRIEVVNLPRARLWDGPGEYLLLLVPVPATEGMAPAGSSPRYRLVSQPRSAGYDPYDPPPVIYRWNESLRRQWQALFSPP
ncbi:MAG: hypothetical protein NZU63_02995 [Gemmataceae bacterium]|nr:hypothetical protein [Gemmataceae bacterium]MDW8241835.1 hypothetical protein [Thermogemmata sp.]